MRIYFLLFFALCVSVLADGGYKLTTPSYSRPYIDSVENSSTARMQQHFRSGSIMSKNEIRQTQSCPNNCTSETNGFCDRRSGYCYCEKGYTGKSCEKCINSYYMSKNNTCQEKILCPDNCNYGGSCDYETGKCICNANRDGDACQLNKCQKFGLYCDKCNAEHCTECSKSYYLNSTDFSCTSCIKYDPRCFTCSEKECTYCADTLLNSLRMSDKMNDNEYPELPSYYDEDEYTRLLSYTYPMNKHDGKYFDDSELYYLVDISEDENKSLDINSMTCKQGLSNDASWECKHKPVLNKVCGTLGLFYIPPEMHEISILENEPFLNITIRRTGGGLGESSVDYMLYHKTTTPSDISPNTFYTVNQTLYFEEGVVEKNISLTIHDDLLYEGNETVYFILYNTSDGAGLLKSANSNFTWSNITIIDDDEDYINRVTFSIDNNTYKAGDLNVLNITFDAYIRSSKIQEDDITIVMEVSHQVQFDSFSSTSFTPPIDGNCTQANGNEFKCMFNSTGAGVIPFNFYIMKPNGLNRYYYINDDYNGEAVISHIDRYINLSYPLVTTMSIESTQLYMEWKSIIKPPETGKYAFIIRTSGYSRMWINDMLIIDNWFVVNNYTVINIDLYKDHYTNFLLRYKHSGDSVDISVSWKIPSKNNEEIINESYFYWYTELINSPQYIRIYPNYPSLYYSTALRLGAVNCVSGSLCSFLILSRDEYQNIITNQSLALWNNQNFEHLYNISMVNNNDTNITIPVTIEIDNESGIITGYYKPEISGNYNLSITLLSPDNSNSSDEVGEIFGSPYQVEIGSGDPYPLNMNISIENTTFVVGKQYNFSIDIVDITFNILNNEEFDNNIDCYIISFYKYSLTQCNINCLGNGTCLFDFIPEVSQNNSIIVTYSNIFLGNIPFFIDVEPEVFSIGNLYCMSTIQCYINLKCDILYEMRDKYDNPSNKDFNISAVYPTITKNTNPSIIQDVELKCEVENDFFLHCSYIPMSEGNDKIIIRYNEGSDDGTIVNLFRTPYSDGDTIN